MINHTTDPPTVRFNEHTKTKFFDLLKPALHGDTHVYELRPLADLAHNLMHWLFIGYDDRSHIDEPLRDLADFSDEERRLYYPFAFMLACLDGNAFRTGQLNTILEDCPQDSPETITQYIPDAYRIIKANSGNLVEIKIIIAQAAG